MTYAEYAALPGIRWSNLKQMAISPLHYKHAIEHPSEPGPALILGTALHAAVLEPDKFESEFAVAPKVDRRTKQGKIDWANFVFESTGKTVLTQDQHQAAMAMAACIQAHPVAGSMLQFQAVEQTVTWTDPDTGLLLKGRPDSIGELLIDLKTTRRQTQQQFQADAARLMYHAQASMYRDGLRANGRKMEQDPHIITVTNVPPHDVAVYRLGHEVIAAGQKLYKRLLVELAACIESDSWPGICPEGVMDFELPVWAMDMEPEQPLTLGGMAVL